MSVKDSHLYQFTNMTLSLHFKYFLQELIYKLFIYKDYYFQTICEDYSVEDKRDCQRESELCTNSSIPQAGEFSINSIHYAILLQIISYFIIFDLELLSQILV